MPKNLGFKKGDKVVVEKAPDVDDVLVIKRAAVKSKTSTSDAEFKRWLKIFMDENGEILDELAQR